MYLSEQEKDLFFKLFFDLLYCVNCEHKIISGFADTRYPKSVDMQKAYQIREKLVENPSWIDDYLQKYGDERTEEERDILLSWRNHFIKSEFFVMRHLAKYSVFMSPGNKGDIAKLYGVIGLNHPIADLFDKTALPVMIDALILPFNGKIIYDGMIPIYNVIIGPGMRKELKELYNISKEKFGIIESLPFENLTPRAAPKTAPKKLPSKLPRVDDEKYNEIARLITQFCDEKLNPEFSEVGLYVLEKLRRKRPSPLLSGKSNTWACGIVYAVASNNFVFDKSQPYYMSAQDIADGFGLSKSTAQNKANEINKMLDISYFSPGYTIASRREESFDMLRYIEMLRKLR